MSSSTSRLVLLLLIFFLSSSLPSAQSFSYTQCRTLIPVAHSLMNRVAELRASRGDFSGAERARKIAQKLEGGFGLCKGIGLMSWDYVTNYAWRHMNWIEMTRSVSDVNRLLKVLNELTQMESDKDKAAWFMRNYQNVLGIVNSVFPRFLQLFDQSGPLRDLVLTLQKEAEGGLLLRDCLQLGSNDLKGVIQIVRDLGLHFSTSSHGGNHNTHYDL